MSSMRCACGESRTVLDEGLARIASWSAVVKRKSCVTRHTLQALLIAINIELVLSGGVTHWGF